MSGRVLAVDHGEKRIGLAISDPTGSLARALCVIRHVSRPLDAAQVAAIAHDEQVAQIIVGVSYDETGQPNLAGRRAVRFAEALRAQCELPVELWDESLTTQDARALRLEMGVSRKKRSGHLDEVAAAVLLQNYLDVRQS